MGQGTPEDLITTDDGMSYLKGSRPVGRDEYLANLPGGLTVPVVARMLALAADDDGFVRDVRINEIFKTHIYDALEADTDTYTSPITYDGFTAGVLLEFCAFLTFTGYLGQRGNGDSYDYQLVLPDKRQVPFPIPAMAD